MIKMKVNYFHFIYVIIFLEKMCLYEKNIYNIKS